MPLHTGTEIIVLQAKGNAGKTTLLNDIISIMSNTSLPVCSITTSPNDKIVIYSNYLCIDGIMRNIAFITEGDSDGILKRNYNNLLSHSLSINIDILVGACRTKGKTVDWWNNLHSSINYIQPHTWRREFWDLNLIPTSYIIDATDLSTVRTVIKI